MNVCENIQMEKSLELRDISVSLISVGISISVISVGMREKKGLDLGI